MRVDFRAKSVLRFSPGFDVTYADEVSVGLPCATCVRTERTVRIGRGGASCIKIEHPFDARVNDLRVETRGGLSIATHAVSYEYEAIVDTKYGDPSNRFPTWGAIRFSVGCRVCGAVMERSTQTNLSRPWTAHCTCGLPKYEETGTLPIFELWPDVQAS